MVNRGIAPLNPLTEVGKFRALSGDTVYDALNPAEEGFGDYEKWSDLEIEAFLESSTSVYWALYLAFMQLATGAALESASIKDYDLAVDTTKRADALLKLALSWKERAEEGDDTDGANDLFDVFPTGGTGDFIAEGTIPIWGRQYTWNRWR